MSGKPVAEQEIRFALLQEVVAYAETSMSRRKFYSIILVRNLTVKQVKVLDDCKKSKIVEAKDQVVKLLEVVEILDIYTNLKKLFYLDR
jgi:ATP-dependent DNA helicase RecQ